jgi:hypothetical protein
MESPMTDLKPWYASRAVWTGLAQIVVGLAVLLGFVDEATSWDAMKQVPEVLTVILGGLGIYYRVIATKKVG